MKKLFSLLIVLISIKCFGQVYQVLPQYGYEMKRVNATLVLLLPSDTTTNKTGVARIGTVLYIGNGTKWTASTVTDATKLNISDTATMLTPYLRKIDTASLSNRINLKANINSPTFTGTFTTAAGAIGNALLANGAVANLSGTNTGDQTTITGNAGTATALQTARTIGTTTGDATSAGSTFNGTANNTNALTLATVNSNVGTFTNSTITVNGKGLITAASSGTSPVTAIGVTTANGVSGTSSGGTTPNLTISLGAITPTSVAASGTVTGSNLSGTNTGDNATNTQYSGLVSNANHTGDATGSTALTLATVNANVGSFGSATQSPTYTVNGKGLLTAAANVTITPAVGSISGLGTGVATALGVNTGSAGAVVLFNGNAGTPSALVGTNITGTASLNINGTVGATTATTGAFTTATASTSVTTPLLIGGTTTTSPLTFKTTTGIGATGARHIFQVGNNGATEAMTILNSANVGIGTATPDSLLTVQQGLFAKRGVRLSGLPTGVGTKALRINATGQLSMADTTGSPTLTSTQIAFGSASNLMTSSIGLIYNEGYEFKAAVSSGGYKSDGTNNYVGDFNANVDGNVLNVKTDESYVTYADNNSHNVKFGINTTTPSVALDVVGDVSISGGFNVNTPADCYLGDVTNSLAIRVSGSNADNIIQFIGYGAGTATFDANGNISSSSDIRLKTNIKSYKTGLKELLQIKPIQYKWNEKSKMETEGTYAGFSAQNVKANIPLGTGENKEGYLSLQDRAIMATLVNAVKELNTKVENLVKQNAKLVKRLNKNQRK